MKKIIYTGKIDPVCYWVILLIDHLFIDNICVIYILHSLLLQLNYLLSTILTQKIKLSPL